ncbi:lipase, partial [Streptomyces lavendulae]
MRLSRLAAVTSSLLLAAGATLLGAGQAAAAQADFGYVALGDSYSSGVGAGNYDSSSGNCKRTSRAYPALGGAAPPPPTVSVAASAGARAAAVRTGPRGAH